MSNVIKLKLPGTHKVHGIGRCGEHIVALCTTNIPSAIDGAHIWPGTPEDREHPLLEIRAPGEDNEDTCASSVLL